MKVAIYDFQCDLYKQKTTLFRKQFFANLAESYAAGVAATSGAGAAASSGAVGAGEVVVSSGAGTGAAGVCVSFI